MLLGLLRADLDPQTERGKLVRSAVATSGLKIGATVLAFGASLLYARILGPHDYGLYVYVIAWVSVVTIAVSLGLPQYLVREAAKTAGDIRRLRKWSDRRVCVAGTIATAMLAGMVFVPQAAGARWLFVIAAPLPLMISLSAVRKALLQALGSVASSQWPSLILSPAITITIVFMIWAWTGSFSSIELLVIVTASALVPLIINDSQLRHATKGVEIVQCAKPHLRAAIPFMWLAGLYLINNRTDLILLGTLKGARDAGIYAVSARAAELVGFFLAASNMVIAPRIARLHHQGQRALLQRLLRSASQRVLALSAPIALIFIVAAQPILVWLYGTAYSEGAVALQVLSIAQLVNVAAGPTATLLDMTGHERLSALGAALIMILNVILNLILIPRYGVNGSAVATGISLVAWNVLLWHWIRRRLDLRPKSLWI